MLNNIFTFLFFSFSGILVECYFLIRHKVKLKEFLTFLLGMFIVFLIFLLVGIAGDFNLIIHELSNLFIVLSDFLILYIFIFLIVFYATFKKIILFTVNEAVLLVFTIIFWYIILTKYSLSPVFLALFILPTIAVLFISFSKVSLNKIWKLFFYVWFLLIDTFFVVYFIFSSHMFSFKDYGNSIFYEGFNLFIISMIFTYLIFNLFSIFYLLPIVTGNQSYKDKFNKINRHINILVEKYSDYQLKRIYSLVIIISLLAFLYFNCLFNFFSDFLMISSVIIISQLFSEKN